jgi:drug/metabolite transporter (DMT)-like permease
MTIATTVKPPASALFGALYVLLAGMAWSFNGVLLRFAPDLDAWQIQTWRGLGCALAFVLIARLQGRPAGLSQFVALRSTGIVIMIAGAVASIGFIIAIKLTTVANALFLSSCSPLLSALLGFVLLGERLGRSQMAAVGLGIAGLLVIVGGGIEAGSLVGNIAALASALGFATMSVAMRMAPGRDYNAAMIAMGLFSALVCAIGCVVKGVPLVPPIEGIAIAFASGFVLIGIGFAFFVRGAPWVPAVGQTLLAQTETIFGPIWVWIAFKEQPAMATLYGGAIILLGVVTMAAAGAGRRPEKLPPHA